MYDKFLVYKVETLLPTFYSLPPKKSKIASPPFLPTLKNF